MKSCLLKRTFGYGYGLSQHSPADPLSAPAGIECIAVHDSMIMPASTLGSTFSIGQVLVYTMSFCYAGLWSQECGYPIMTSDHFVCGRLASGRSRVALSVGVTDHLLRHGPDLTSRVICLVFRSHTQLVYFPSISYITWPDPQCFISISLGHP